jgi:hypothetical protein
MTLPPLPAFTEFRTIAQRSRNWMPIQSKLRMLIQQDMAARPGTKTPTSTGNLDRSLKGLDVWRAQRLSVEWGTDLEYAKAHDNYRRKHGKDPIIDYADSLDKQLTEALKDWILHGRRS